MTGLVEDSSVVAILPELIVLAAALLLMIADFIVPRQRERFPLLAAAAACVALLQSVFMLEGPYSAVFGGAAVVDIWTGAFRIISYLSAMLSLLLLMRNRAGDVGSAWPGDSGELSILILLSSIGVSVMAASRDLLVTVIALEIMSLAVYPIIALPRRKANQEAAVKYFLMGSVASAIMLFGMSFLFRDVGTTRYMALPQADQFKLIGMTLFAMGLFFKMAAVPFHSWLPDVYETTPSQAGGFMAAALKAAAFAALGRFLVFTLPNEPLTIKIYIALSVATMLMGNTAALLQTNLGRLWGYSALAHTGFLLMGIAASAQQRSANGLGAVVVYLFAYVPAAIGIFALLGIGEREAEIAGRTNQDAGRNLTDLNGLFRRCPASAVALTILMASLAGIPPTAGFWGKLEIFVASFDAGHLGLLGVALLNSLFAAYYYVRVIREAFTDASYEKGPVPSGIKYVLVLCSIIILASGILPDVMMRIAKAAAISLGHSL